MYAKNWKQTDWVVYSQQYKISRQAWNSMPDYKDNDIQIELIRFECGKITKVYDMQYLSLIHILSTTLSYKVEAKGKDRDEIAFFAKFVLCSNNEY